MAKRLPEHWRETFCTLIAEGYTLSDAAKAVGVAAGTVRRHTQEDQEFRVLYADARETIRDTIRNEIWKARTSDDFQERKWAYDHLVKWNLPEAKETQKVEIAGAVDVVHRRGITVADLLADPRAHRLVEAALRELPAAGEILAEPARRLDPASDLPSRPDA